MSTGWGVRLGVGAEGARASGVDPAGEGVEAPAGD